MNNLLGLSVKGNSERSLPAKVHKKEQQIAVSCSILQVLQTIARTVAHIDTAGRPECFMRLHSHRAIGACSLCSIGVSSEKCFSS
jgi:hypothetical protein